jgi:hypothetical protein
VPFREISAWLGHAEIQTTSIYVRTTQASLMQAVERLERMSEKPMPPAKKGRRLSLTAQSERHHVTII